ncbi:MAG: RecX family transcriptional regulator [Candidatus Binatota bacterium]|nr:RecX family transcriptional regulator [Candidatus Binatota bacterium]
MKITGIKQQVKRTGRYSVFVDDKYSFSLSDTALLDSKLSVGQELDHQQVRELKQASSDDKLYNNTLRYIAIRPRTKWEIETYLKRKEAPPTLMETILNKLSINGLIDDEKFAKAFVNDRRLLRPTSRRRMILELRKKHVAGEIIEAAVGTEAEHEQVALLTMIEVKRRQSKYQDDLKLMQYLARQGFSYGDIKSALQDVSEGR